ncbi:hypothetical protein CDAR_474231 [Caerostris darwini]|uniref:Uncharacterized protein n=1 Tax=Caerostris darwini TaxID=1538125 RepID=A0AAV4SJH6_9ARAC|nr:hypothetical protein CDAR_474231 [Caerostris darwini]
MAHSFKNALIPASIMQTIINIFFKKEFILLRGMSSLITSTLPKRQLTIDYRRTTFGLYTKTKGLSENEYNLCINLILIQKHNLRHVRPPPIVQRSTSRVTNLC